MSSFRHLLSPGRIGTLETRNRIAVSAMGVSLAEEDGSAGDRLIAYHEAQAAGGVGLVVTGASSVMWPVGAVQRNQVAISDDRYLPGMRRLAQAVQKHGARIAAQLHMGGLVAGYAAKDGHPLWAPSMPGAFEGDFVDYFLPEELAAFAGGPVPEIKVLEKADMAELAARYAEAAVRVREAGFDAAELHGGHGYILSSFLSPKTNRRTDEYGGSPENRARLIVEVTQAVRAAVGRDFPVWVKLDSKEVLKDGGITIDDAVITARLLKEAGADGFVASAYHDTGRAIGHSASNIPHDPGANLVEAKALRAATGLPVFAVGRIEPEVGDRVIGAGEADFIGMGRKLLADPALPRLLGEGRAKDVRPCIYCYTCVSAIYTREATRCAVRPETAYEYQQVAPSVAPGKHYVVVGGGPGGMEAARRLDAAGHRVTLIERGARLGGTLRFASLAYAANERLLDWLTDQVAKSKVEVRLSTEATPELLRSLAPDAVLVATGAQRTMPAIPGAEQDHVLSGDDLRALMLGEDAEGLKRKTGLMTRIAAKVGAKTGMTANLDFVRSATRQWMPLGQNVVIVGGELVGVELAEFLVERGRTVTVIEEQPRLGRGLLLVRRLRLLAELKAHGVAMHGGVTNIAIGKDAVSWTGADGAAQSAPGDNVIVAKGATADTRLADLLAGEGFAVHAYGDATGVTYLEGAIRGAADTVRALLSPEAPPIVIH